MVVNTCVRTILDKIYVKHVFSYVNYNVLLKEYVNINSFYKAHYSTYRNIYVYCIFEV